MTHPSALARTFAPLLTALPGLSFAAPSPEPPAPNLRLVFLAGFEQGKLDAWQPTDTEAWRIEDVDDGRALALFQQSKYKPEVRSPLNINLAKGVDLGSFVLDLRMRSTTKDYGHRDLCLFFGHQDPSHFYYVHIANNSDAHANSIFAVDGAPRVSIAEKRTAGTKWDDNWHHVRLTRDVDTGAIRVFFDDLSKPIMEATDKRFTAGPIGVGSFDDTGLFDDIRLWEPVSRTAAVAPKKGRPWYWWAGAAVLAGLLVAVAD